jgi:glyoxylase-like metal-dependent hydrolase (beta-lactamase superfamily II)
MNGPVFFAPRPVAPETFLLPGVLPLPGLGVLPINAFLIRGAEPVLVDTGLAAWREPFLAALDSLIDPGDLRWIWLTHTDADHLGSFTALLERAPRATVATTYLGLGKLGLQGIQPERVRLVNPGETLDVGDRTLTAWRPPVYDAPETTGFIDPSTRTLFSSDSFGALLDAPAETLEAIPKAGLREGMIAWAGVDAPWLHTQDEGTFLAQLAGIRKLAPERVLSSHLPPAPGNLGVLLDHLGAARTAPPFRGPNQADLEAMMAGA